MGAENSILEGCEWGAPLESALPWDIYPVIKPDGSTATVFQAKKAEKKDGDLLKTNTLILRGIRHPNIIRYVGGGEAREDLWLATESVKPLLALMADLTPDEICAGLHDLLQAIDFLHSKLGMCHNNLGLSSLFVGHDGTWKLGELQHACKFSDATPAFLDQCRAFRSESSLSPEEKAGTMKLNPATGHARDMYAFGVIVEALLERLDEKDDRMKHLEHQAVACLCVDPALRPTAATLLNLPLFRSDLFEIINFVKNVTMKSDADKKDFFSKVVMRLTKLPETVLARRLVIPLLARFVLLDQWADTHVIPCLLTPKTASTPHGLLSESLYTEYVTPQLYNIFHVHDCHIRLVLLRHFSQYVHLFSRQQLDDDIFLQILLGVRDSDDRVVAASLRALADLVPIMGGDVVVGAARKPFFFHGLPKQIDPQDLAKMSASVPQNVTSVLSSHKPLLKDLAAGSMSALIKKEKTDEEKERKAREREQRREEAKLKREERRKRLKEKQTDKEGEVNHIQSESEPLGLTIEEVARLEGTKNFSKDDDDDNGDEDVDLKASLKGSVNGDFNTNSTYCVESGKTEGGKEEQEEEEEREGPDWSDWEDADQRIEEEIEEDLRQMSDDMSETGGGANKVQTSPSPYRRQSSPPPPPPPTAAAVIDWDFDVPEAERDIGRVELVSNGVDELPGTGAASNKASASKSLKLKNAASSSSSSNTAPKSASVTANSSSASHKAGTKEKSLDELGAGLDIKSVEIKVKSQPELDFFADMAPSIQMSPRGESSRTAVMESESEVQPKIDSKLFAVSSAPDQDGQEASGWGEDDALDWNAEDF